MDNIESIKSVFPDAQVDSLHDVLKTQYSPAVDRDEAIEFGEELIGLLEALVAFEEPTLDHVGMTKDDQRT